MMQENSVYRNPVVRGFSPDPSICRVGEDFYLVTSSFEFAPGVPVYHSRDLSNWELINYCLRGEEHLPLDGVPDSMGVFAPTIRYHDGTFFMTTTIMGRGNLITHTRDIRGNWSRPVPVRQGGIDPSLLFDADGSVYFCSTGDMGEAIELDSIYCSRIDPFTGELLSDCRRIYRGQGESTPEAPHLYERNGFYYLLLAVGGTEYAHAVSVHRSASPFGPFEPHPRNPILTHRGKSHPVQCVGHADIVEDGNGNWWMVALGIRQLPQAKLHNLGRETFLAPMTWDDEGWPVVGVKGMLETWGTAPLPQKPQAYRDVSFHTSFREPTLSLEFNTIRHPLGWSYRLLPQKGMLLMEGGAVPLSNRRQSPAFLGIRQREHLCTALVSMSAMDMPVNSRCGLAAICNASQHYEIYLTRGESGYAVALNRRIIDLETECERVPLDAPPGRLWLRASADRKEYRYSYSLDGDTFFELGAGSIAGLCGEATATGSFNGVYIGMFACGCTAAFHSFDCDMEDSSIREDEWPGRIAESFINLMR